MEDKGERHLKDIMAELDDETAFQGFNRSKPVDLNYPEYFDNHDSATPSNTPSAKMSQGISLKNVDFSRLFQKEQGKDDISTDIDPHLNYCKEVYLGASKNPVGIANENAQRTCGSLICTKCDTKVSMFKNKKWCESADYLFFRNNYGDHIKLSEVST